MAQIPDASTLVMIADSACLAGIFPISSADWRHASVDQHPMVAAPAPVHLWTSLCFSVWSPNTACVSTYELHG